VDNFKTDLGERSWGGVDWIDVAHDRIKWRALVNTVMNLHVPYNAGKLSSNYTTGCPPSSAEIHRVR
jgi:hypothetical protein